MTRISAPLAAITRDVGCAHHQTLVLTTHLPARRVRFQHRLMQAGNSRRRLLILVDLKQPPRDVPDFLLQGTWVIEQLTQAEENTPLHGPHNDSQIAFSRASSKQPLEGQPDFPSRTSRIVTHTLAYPLRVVVANDKLPAGTGIEPAEGHFPHAVSGLIRPGSEPLIFETALSNYRFSCLPLATRGAGDLRRECSILQSTSDGLQDLFGFGPGRRTRWMRRE